MLTRVMIAGAARTAIGSFQGIHKDHSTITLGSAAIHGALGSAGLAPETVGEVLMGCVLPAGLGQAPARQASIGAGIPPSVPATTVNKVCGSGMKALMLAFDGIRSGSFEAAVAGGMENMTNAPYLLPKARGGYRYGHGQLLDHMAFDGLEDAYQAGRSMGTFAEDTTAEYGFSRGEQDDYALASLERAREATQEGRFAGEIVALGDHDADEQPARIRPEKIPLLKPAFREGGIVTAAHSSPISDGAAALVVAGEAFISRNGLTPRATVLAHATVARAPALFTTAPVGAISTLLGKVGWSVGDVDLFEINEAFAVVPMVAMRDLGILHDRLNVNGGACALGHPIGASGARIVVTLLNALEQRGGRRGIAAICLGGGEATAVAIERGEG